jgi:hypothetical protein
MIAIELSGNEVYNFNNLKSSVFCGLCILF